MKYSRNLSNIPFLPHAKLNTRKHIKDTLVDLISKYYKGVYIDSTTEDENDKKTFDDLNNRYFDKELNFLSCNLAGEHTGIFKPEDNNDLIFLINFNDHLQVIKTSEFFDLGEAFNSINTVMKNLESSNDKIFEKNEKYGYINCCPTNIGTGFKISSFVKIPKVINDGNTVVQCNKWSLRTKKNLDTSNGRSLDEYEIQSKCKLNVNEITFLNAYYYKIHSFINFENKLKSQSNFTVKKHEHYKLMSESLKSLYDYFYDKYRLVSSYNGESFYFFNDQFGLDTANNKIKIRPSDYNSFSVYRDFYFDYITGITGMNMVELCDKFSSKKEDCDKFYSSFPTKGSSLSLKGEDFLSVELLRNLKDINLYQDNKEIKDKVVEVLEKNSYKNMSVFNNTIYSNNKIEVSIGYSDTNKNYLKFHTNTNDLKPNELFNSVESIVNEVEKVAGFKRDGFYGYLNTDILKCGSGLRIKLYHKVNEETNMKDLLSKVEKYDLLINENKDDQIADMCCIENINCIGVTQEEIVDKFVKFCNEL